MPLSTSSPLPADKEVPPIKRGAAGTKAGGGEREGEAPEGVLFGSQQLPVGETPGPEVVLWLRDMCGKLITLCLWDCMAKLGVEV